MESRHQPWDWQRIVTYIIRWRICDQDLWSAKITLWSVDFQSLLYSSSRDRMVATLVSLISWFWPNHLDPLIKSSKDVDCLMLHKYLQRHESNYPLPTGIINIARCLHFKQLSFNSFRDGLPGSWMATICHSGTPDKYATHRALVRPPSWLSPRLGDEAPSLASVWLTPPPYVVCGSL